MSHKWTVTILMLFAVVISSEQFVGEPIHCWCPAEFTDAHISYTNNYCWVANTYHVPMSDVISVDEDVRREATLSYYQWVPLILLVQAMFFKLPCVLWHVTNTSSGINLSKLCSMVDTLQVKVKTERAKTIRNITMYLDRWLIQRRHYRNGITAKLKRKTSCICFFCFGQQEGLFLSGLYLLIKMLYLVNCIVQFWMLSIFLSLNFLQYGVDSLDCIMGNCSGIERSSRFPRVTLCDFEIRQMQNIQPYTVQCVLPINLFNEKIFVLIWIWILILSCISFTSLLTWLQFMVIRNSRRAFVRRFLVETGDTVGEKVLLKKFADQYLRTDGCFLLKIVRTNTSDVTLTDLMTDIWHRYKDSMKAKQENK